ncbi:MAG: hydantoinase/oxoprolinase family protein [Acidimicrobiia bacterium]
MRVGVDAGGTFTDFVTRDGRIAKVASDPADPAAPIRAVLAEVTGGTPATVLAHGTTVATNALLERRGATVALVTTEGHQDVLEIARQDRPSLYDPFADRPVPLVPRPLRFGVVGRLAADGSEVVPLDLGGLDALPEDVDAVAVCLLHADLEPAHEEAVATALHGRGFDVTVSSVVSPEMREYERAVTTTVNAYLRPACRTYLRRLADLAPSVLVLSSAGGLLPVEVAAELPAALLLSGPAGGVRAAAEVAAANGFADCVTFDMGGTSTDVCLVRGGLPEAAVGREVAGFPVRLPSIDVHTIGAGGGSIARIDPGGALAVGPRSAGAVPGPACYGRGGTEPTVTDADLLLGRIPAGAAFPGVGVLDRSAAAAACARAGVTPDGVVTVADAHMTGAIRRVTVERGVDPRGLALVAFGGAGPLHACALAEALGMAAVLVPARAGVLSAAGIMAAPEARELVRTWPTPASVDGLEPARAALAGEVAARVGPGATAETWIDCRYPGQSHELTVASVDDFGTAHRRVNGHDRPGSAVEVVALRARASRPSPVRLLDLPVPSEREGGRPVAGPAVVIEPDCTVWVPAGWRAQVGEAGALVLRRDAAGTGAPPERVPGPGVVPGAGTGGRQHRWR